MDYGLGSLNPKPQPTFPTPSNPTLSKQNFESNEHGDLYGLVQKNMVVSQNWVPQYRPLHTIILIMGTFKKVPLISGNPYMGLQGDLSGPMIVGG